MRLRFDRGTVLFLEPPAGADASDLPGALWDPRVCALRAPAMLHPAIAAALTQRGVRYADEIDRPADLPGTWTEPPLRPYQDSALWAWQRAGRRGLVVLPTGAGKTRVAAVDVDLLRLRIHGRDRDPCGPGSTLLPSWAWGSL